MNLNFRSNLGFLDKQRSILFILVIGLGYSACAPVGPNYSSPQATIASEWDLQVAAKLESKPKTDLENWWILFNDPTLDTLIQKAKDQNQNLKIAFSRVQEARAEVAGMSGSKLPSVGADASVARNKQSDVGSLEQLAPAGGFNPQSLFSVGISSSWEIDVFGRIRRSVESANYGYERSIADYYDVMVILLADVATNYVDLRANQQRRINTELNIKTQISSLELAKVMYNSGLTSYLDVLQAQSNLAETKSEIPFYQLQEYLAINRISLLLGITYDSLGVDLTNNQPIPVGDPNIGIGLPVDLLRQRPDIRAAERFIAENTANIGVSTASLYPTFSLAGSLGLSSKSVGSLFTAPALGWGISLPISWEIFNRKRIKANIAINEQQTQQALLNYENTVLNAFMEVENLISSYQLNSQRNIYLVEAVSANAEAVVLVKVQYESGLTDFQNVLDTERSLYRQQNKVLNAEATMATDLIKLYKALGGGWTVTQNPDVAPSE